MAVAKPITNKSSGIYTREIDLTVITNSVGTFAGASIGITEKGPAFQVSSSSTFSERVLRLGDLNPNYPSSYFAREFLEQANNYKEVRVLGFEGYNEQSGDGGTDKIFPILYDVAGVATRTPAGTGPFTSPVIASPESIGAVLKPRRTTFTSFDAVEWVEVATILQRDGITTSATDDLFALIIHYTDSLKDITVPCSLRPGAKEYIVDVFGANPRDQKKIQGRTSPLWVDFVFPSVQTRPDITSTLAYYYPGTLTTGTPGLSLATGDVTTSIGFNYASVTIDTSISIGVNAVVTWATPLGSAVPAGTPITFTGTGSVAASNVVGAPLLTAATFYVGTPTTTTSFHLFADAALTVPVTTTGTYSGGSFAQVFLPTWEPEIMNLGGSSDNDAILFQTPTTPWFVSDADVNGAVQNLFRLWSISDGDSANIEIKVEVLNINPDGNLGSGSFDIQVRQFTDRDDLSKVVFENFANLTMDPKSDNYIARRIGDGEIFPLQSRYIFVELNELDVLPNNALPYGVEGYINIEGIVFPDVVWSNEYDFTKSLSKQTLGLAHNNTNMLAPITPDMLAFKNVINTSSATGKGFHLNPQNNSNINTALFVLADQTMYQVNPPSNTSAISGTEKSKRSRFVVCFAGGFDGFNLYNERSWANPLSKDFAALQAAIDILADNESLDSDFSVLVTPDINFQDDGAAVEAVLEMVVGRGDALYIPDFRYDVEADPNIAKLDLQSSNINSNFSAIYFPHVQIEDLINKTNIWLPPSLIALATIAATATNEQVWQPPAGSLRTITSNLVRTRKRMRLNDREILKSANINPITLFPGSGFEITESRTTQEIFSALSFVHNRLLLGYAKKALNQTLRPILHQLNTVSLRNAFVNTITPIFDKIKKLNGLEEFKVSVVDNQDDQTTLYGVIEIVPLYPVERIVIDFTLKNGALDFNK
jgi:hypothetical protein